MTLQSNKTQAYVGEQLILTAQVQSSGTTQSNKDYQRDYLLTLELINIYDGHTEKESAELSKGYRRGPLAKLRS